MCICACNQYNQYLILDLNIHAETKIFTLCLYLPKNPNRQAKVGEERANCPLCERNYGTKQSLRFHLKTNHPELDTGKIANILSEIQNVKN